MDRYKLSGGKRLRCGITTGTCAAAAAGAAARLLLTGIPCDAVLVTLPGAGPLRVPVAASQTGEGCARCCVRKDAGDDPDITDGIEIWAEVALNDEKGVAIDGGDGVGRVTLPGLDQPVGHAAINSVPRKMIAETVQRALDEAGHGGGAKVTICIPRGAELALKTFNPRLGIVGGLSVLGTSGIVEPMSEQALVDSLRLEVRMRAALGRRTILIAPGNYGVDFLRDRYAIPDRAVIRCSNYVGELLDAARENGFERILLVGHLGKLVKLAGNVFNTHSHYGDCRVELLAAHAAKYGLSAPEAEQLLASATVDQALNVLEAAGRMRQTLNSVLAAARNNLRLRTGVEIPLALFTNVRGLLTCSEDFHGAMKDFLQEEAENGTFCGSGTGSNGSDHSAGTAPA